jgi:pyruvate,orthophosphate dikinase
MSSFQCRESIGDGKAEGKAGKANMRDLLGGKGANLAEMSNLGLPVPPGFTITTEVCTYYYANNGKAYPADLKAQVESALAEVGKIVGKQIRRRRRIRCWCRCAPARAPRCRA